jgi:hypothetical protein
MMSEPVEERSGQLLIAGKDGHPFRKREIRGDDRGSSFVAVRDQIEEEVAPRPDEGDESELVDDKDLDSPQPLLQTRELAGVARFEELAH